MTDISRAERRLIAALDRLDHAVERGARRIAQTALMQAVPVDAPAVDAAPDLAGAGPVSDEIAALHGRQAATLEAMQMRLAEAHDRLASAGVQAARLAGANDELSRANRALIDATSGDWAAQGGEATRAALEAEIEALRAARAAEIAQMAEILDALDRMLGVTTTPRSHSTDARKAARGAGAATSATALDQSARSAAAAPVAAASAATAAAAAAEMPRELTVIPGDDPLPEDMPARSGSADDDPLPEDADDVSDPDSPFDDDAPADTAGSPLFGGVYDDDPGALDTDPDDEERR